MHLIASIAPQPTAKARDSLQDLLPGRSPRIAQRPIEHVSTAILNCLSRADGPMTPRAIVKAIPNHTPRRVRDQLYLLLADEQVVAMGGTYTRVYTTAERSRELRRLTRADVGVDVRRRAKRSA